MAVYKNESNNTWYVMTRYQELDRRAQAEMQAWLLNEAGGNGMGESVPTPEKSKCQYDDGKLLQII